MQKNHNIGFDIISDFVTTNKVVFVRCDFNVPIKNGKIFDDSRIIASMETINYLIASDAKVVIGTHLGRPNGKVVPELSTKIIADYLETKIRSEVFFVDDCIGEKVRQTIAKADYGDVIVLENLRFYEEEENCDLGFAKALTENVNIFVNDCFSCSHRGHASIFGMPLYVRPAAGFALAKEVQAIEAVLQGNIKNTIAVIGGSKVSTKIGILKNLVKKIDCLVIGGGMANTFLYANGFDVGISMREDGMIDVVKEIYQNATESGCQIIIPDQIVVAKSMTSTDSRTINIKDIHQDEMILDISEEFVYSLKTDLQKADAILWNGPLGVFEVQPFHKGTFAMANLIADISKVKSTISVAGGGDSVAAINLTGRGKDFSFISNAGGAFLEFVEGKSLPGYEILKRMKTAYHD